MKKKLTSGERWVRVRRPVRSQVDEARRSLAASREKYRLAEERRWWQQALHESGVDLDEECVPGLPWRGLVDLFLAAVPPREVRRTFMVVAMLAFRRYLTCATSVAGTGDGVSTVGPYAPDDASRMMSALRATMRRRGSRAGRRGPSGIRSAGAKEGRR